ncbi:hypothetical protein [Bdellovibrio sp. HCB2-146]|uniref:hypothetical protein n=1 Tax=Bdellovibrio sp. HCB2-146 TaxID=3394362 RepID=UPI0039BCE578
MKSKFVQLLCAAAFAFSLSACSTTEPKKEETQVPEMSVNMPAEIPTETAVAPVAEEQPVKAKKATKTKKKSAKKKQAS